MQPQPRPLYDPKSAQAAYRLRYAWTCWPSAKIFAATPTEILASMAPLWETAGLRLLETSWTREKLQIVFSAQPCVSPLLLATRAKGRLTHALRLAGVTIPLSRKTAVRSLGENITQDVEQYIEAQVKRERFIDRRFEQQMAAFTVRDRRLDLSQPNESTRGRYWCNLHLVLVVAERLAIADDAFLGQLRDGCLKIAAKKGYRISRLAVMPDHLHLALRGDYRQSPEEIVFAFQNNLAYLVGQKRVWQDSYYVGTFGEYNMNAIRRRVAEKEKLKGDETPANNDEDMLLNN